MMKRTMAMVMLLSFFLPLSMALEEAFAARMGGGKSFGGKSSYSNSYSKPTTPAKDSGAMQSQAAKTGQAPGGFMSRFGGLGGMLGGLLIGGMLGSLLFGGGFGLPGLLDVLLIGGGLFLLFKFLRSRRAATASGPQAANREAWSYAGGSPEGAAPRAGQADGQAAGWPTGGGAEAASQAKTVPAGFDKEEFLGGAKAAYSRLQSSWDRRDMEDIRRFTTPAVFEEIRRQAADDQSSSRTEILLVNASLLEVRSEGRETVASVHLDVLMRENPTDQQPTQVREVWHFKREETTPNAEWLLDGIQQLEK